MHISGVIGGVIITSPNHHLCSEPTGGWLGGKRAGLNVKQAAAMIVVEILVVSNETMSAAL